MSIQLYESVYIIYASIKISSIAESIPGDVQVSTGIGKLMFRLSGYIITKIKLNAKIVAFIGGRRQVAMAA